MDYQPPSRVQAWIQIIVGIILALGGLASLIDTTSAKIYLGALIVGPIFVFRGVQNLRLANDFYRQNPQLETNPGGAPARLDPRLALRDGSLRVWESCMACGKRYMYFPEMTTDALTKFMQHGNAAAPCPACGFIQPHMFAVADEFAPNRIATLALQYSGIGFFFGSAIGLLVTMMTFHGSVRSANPEHEVYYWILLGGALLTALVCTIWWWIRSVWPGDPNSAPLARRLARGRLLGMPLEEYNTLVNVESPADGKPPAPAASLQATDAIQSTVPRNEIQERP